MGQNQGFRETSFSPKTNINQNLIYEGVDLDLSQIFEKIMQFMSQTSHSLILVSFFAKFIHSDIMTLSEILFCRVEIIFEL